MTKMTSEEKPRRLESTVLIEQELKSELMIFDSARNQAFCLNKTAAFVWKNSDGKTSVAEMAGKSQGLAEPVDEEAILYALTLLEDDGLLMPPEAGRSYGRAITRRDLLQKIGVAAIPMITVLFVHPAKAHASSMASAPSGPGQPGGELPSISNSASGSRGDGGFWKWLTDLFS